MSRDTETLHKPSSNETLFTERTDQMRHRVRLLTILMQTSICGESI